MGLCLYIIHQSTNVCLPSYALMVIDLGVFQVAQVPMNWYEYWIPFFGASYGHPISVHILPKALPTKPLIFCQKALPVKPLIFYQKLYLLSLFH